MDKSLEQKIEELWNREQIKSLTYAYGECIFRRDAEGLAKLFTEDGAVDFSALGQDVHRGRAALAEFYGRGWARRIRPFFTNHYIEFHAPDRASGWCWFDNRGKQDDESLIGAGKIYDDYRLVEGRWLFAARRVAPFFMVPLSRGWARELG